jgi:PIN domain nuclease of toxin-antitoxin system
VKLLLDTHSFLWFIAGDARLSEQGRALIEDSDNEKFVSIASIWEIAIKTSLGKLPLTKPFEQFIPEQIQRNGLDVLGLRVEHAAKVALLPFHHRDPFDRMIVAQSLAEDIAVVSNDAILDDYGIKRLW